MMRYRKWALVSGIFFVLALLIDLASAGVGSSLWFVLPVLCCALPMWIAMHGIVCRLHGRSYAFWHVFASVILTPAFLTGIILVPLVVAGDAKRLEQSVLVDAESDAAG